MPGTSEFEIVAVRATAVRVGRLPDFRPRTAKGAPSSSEYALIEIETAGGAVGLGEATTSPAWNGEDAVGTVDLLQRVLGPDLLGLPVGQWSDIARVLDARVRRRPFLRAGLEMACLDAEGQVRGVPAAELLGRVRRDRFDTKFVLPAREPVRVEEMAREALSRGARSLKVKVGLDLATDLDRVRRVRAVAGGRSLSIDANEGWATDDPARLASLLRPLDLAGIEQPFPRSAVPQTAALRAGVGAALVADESVWDAGDVVDEGLHRAFSEVSLYPGKVGGLRRCLRLAELARTRGMPVTYGSNLELGVGAAAMAHVMAVTPELSARVPSDLIGPLYFESSLVNDAGFVTFAGATLPGGPGLGVRIDRDALEEHRFS